MNARRISLNGKFLSAAPTGVHRVAAELGNSLADLIAEQHPSAQGLRLEVLAPRNGMAQAAGMRMPAKCLGPFVGIPWEQLTLPMRRPDGLLLNLCNIGPMLSKNAITMIHDAQVLLSPESYSAGFRAWYRLVQPTFARRHRHILTVSEFSRGEIVKAGLRKGDAVSVIHNGVDHMLRVPADLSICKQLALKPGTFVVALANTQRHKNIAVLLEAFALPAMADLQLVLFGSATREDFQALGHRVPPNVIFAGKISDGALRGLIEHALCLAFPSLTEGFGLPPLEAMLLGCPAVVAPCGALPEVCGDAADYAHPHEPEAWVQAIAMLASDPNLRAARSERARQHAVQFTWRKAAISLAGILARV